MRSYKIARRNFIVGTGAAIGLHTLLRNAEAAAEGGTSPGRLLITHHPVGTVRPAWLCKGSGADFTFSEVLEPFETAGLKENMLVIDGLNMDLIRGPGGGHEKGSVIMATGAPTKWTRTGQTETDDPMAGGPSLDQMLLAFGANFKDKTPFKHLYALCDDRIDHQEISCRCLSYSMDTRPQPGNGPTDEPSYEHIPLRPELKPLALYNRVFGKMAAGTSDAAIENARARRKSVLDFSLRELKRLRTLAPSSQKAALDAHEQAIRDLERELDGLADPLMCSAGAPPPDIFAIADDGKDHNEDTTATQADDTQHEAIGKAFQAIIRASFVCDLTRVATFQWSPGTNHIAFKGLHPDKPDGIFTHHPVSHQVGDDVILQADASKRIGNVQFLVNVERWYNTRMADFINTLKTTKDVFGNNLLDNTVVPYLTEVSIATHAHNPMPLALFGGKNLGFAGGQFLNLKDRPYVDLLLTLMTSLGVTEDMLQGMPILKSDFNGVLDSVWTKPV